jgi:class 3 adenylate cyclase
MMNAGYEFDKKESIFNLELAQQNRQRFILTILLGTSLLAVFAIFFSLKSVARQRKISDKLLLNILPSDTALELKKSGVAKAKYHEGVSIVFADVKSFTAIASTMDASELVQVLDFYFREFDAIIEEMGLEKIKTIGDAYMFVAGLQDNTDSAKKAVEASLRMLQAASKASVEMRKRYGEAFKFRFGIHTGNVVSGVVGHVKYAFDIWGDAVNIAARMESNSEPGKVNILEDTYTLIKDEYKCTPRGLMEAKN